MGITYLEGTVEGPTGKKSDIKFLIDSGATYSLLPKKIWESIDLEEKRRMSFVLADGTPVERGASKPIWSFRKERGHTPVLLGEEDDEALLGVVTLEIMGLVFNPFDRTLHPMRMLMKELRG